VIREVPLLMKVGLIMMALALLIGAVIVSATVGSEPGGLLAAEVATKALGQAPHTSSGEEGSVTKNSYRIRVNDARNLMPLAPPWATNGCW
jgi:hypothetical protein